MREGTKLPDSGQRWRTFNTRVRPVVSASLFRAEQALHLRKKSTVLAGR